MIEKDALNQSIKYPTIMWALFLYQGAVVSGCRVMAMGTGMIRIGTSVFVGEREVGEGTRDLRRVGFGTSEGLFARRVRDQERSSF